MLCCVMAWHGMVRCKTVSYFILYDIVWYDIGCFDIIWYNIWYCMVRYVVMRSSMVVLIIPTGKYVGIVLDFWEVNTAWELYPGCARYKRFRTLVRFTVPMEYIAVSNS